MRRAGRTDANQTAVVAALREIGCSVAITSGAGNGLPDLIVGVHGVNLLIEIKDSEKVPSAKKLTPAEQYFVDNWKGHPVRIVETPEEAVNYVIAVTR
jgi:Holliday junction resolvase